MYAIVDTHELHFLLPTHYHAQSSIHMMLDGIALHTQGI